MNTNALKRLTVDLYMSALMIALMAYQVVGDAAHEVLGMAVGVLFLAHAWLNRRWFVTFYKGKFTVLRALQNTLIILVLLDALAVMATGVMISGTVFAFLDIRSGVALARTLHICSSYWALVLMSCHVGLHWSAVMAMTRSVFGRPALSGAALWALRLATLAFAAYGALAFDRLLFWDYLTLKMQFAFFSDSGDLTVLFDWMAVMGLFVFLSYWLGQLAQRCAATKGRS
ncbi:MAG: DUF4405 domain-containing protein [Pyramidobacter sp.]|nr:DUF4405 domain-containing protein [Pyramidobacter sp.]